MWVINVDKGRWKLGKLFCFWVIHLEDAWSSRPPLSPPLPPSLLLSPHQKILIPFQNQQDRNCWGGTNGIWYCSSDCTGIFYTFWNRTQAFSMLKYLSFSWIPTILQYLNPCFLWVLREISFFYYWILQDKILEKDVTKGKLTREKMEETKKLITTTTDLKDFKDVDFVIEVLTFKSKCLFLPSFWIFKKIS